MQDWRRVLNGDPLPWLLEPEDPSVRHMTLLQLLDRPADDPAVIESFDAAMQSEPISAILVNQHPDGYWVKRGHGYSPKYTSTVWSVIILDQLGADGADPRIQNGCEYLLSHTTTTSGGFGFSGSGVKRPSPSSVVHCLNGNLLRALIGFGWLNDERVQLAIDWQARSITGEDFERYYKSGTTGPGFACFINGALPCGWGAVKALRGLARIPANRRDASVRAAIDQGVEFLLSCDPATAAYPTSSTISPNWFKLGFPSGYVADVLQACEVLSELGHAKEPRLSHAIDWLMSKQDDHGRWHNQYAYNHKQWSDIEKQGASSKWVTLRACSVLKKVLA